MRAAERQFNYTAWFTYQGDDSIEPFGNFFEAVEWCCVRLENVGEKRERFAKAKVEYRGALVWEMPETERRQANPFGFAQFTIK